MVQGTKRIYVAPYEDVHVRKRMGTLEYSCLRLDLGYVLAYYTCLRWDLGYSTCLRWDLGFRVLGFGVWVLGFAFYKLCLFRSD